MGVEIAVRQSERYFNGSLKMPDMKLRDMKNRHQTTEMENARHENAGNAFLSSYP